MARSRAVNAAVEGREGFQKNGATFLDKMEPTGVVVLAYATFSKKKEVAIVQFKLACRPRTAFIPAASLSRGFKKSASAV